MAALEWFKKRFKDEAKHYLVHEVPPDHVRLQGGEEAGAEPIEANQHYFRLWLSEMFIKNDRDWFASWHPAVHSAVSLDFGNQTRVISRVSGPSNLKDVDQAHLDRVVSQNHPLTTLIPFRGGTVGVDAGLLAMKGKDDVKAFINVLGTFSGMLAVPQLSTALSFAEPLADGISELVEATSGKLTVGLNKTFASAGGGGDSILREAYLAVIFATDNGLDKEKLWVVGDKLRYGAGPKENESEHLTGRHYMLLRIERRVERDDWDSLSLIQEPFKQAIELVAKPDGIPQADRYIRTAIANAMTADELTEADRTRVIGLLKERYKERKEQFQLGAFQKVSTSLQELMPGAISIEAAAAEPPLTAERAFRGL